MPLSSPHVRQPAAGSKSSRTQANPWVNSGNSTIHGRGVYARCDIPDGTRIIEYVGEKITKAEAWRREARRLERARRGRDGSVYIFELNQRYDLDGGTRRNIARLINHSCAPNCRAETSQGKIWILARRDIVAGEELTFDYGYGYSLWEDHPCRCGAPRCVGYIVNSAQRWRVRKILQVRRRAAQLERRSTTSDQRSSSEA